MYKGIRKEAGSARAYSCIGITQHSLGHDGGIQGAIRHMPSCIFAIDCIISQLHQERNGTTFLPQTAKWEVGVLACHMVKLCQKKRFIIPCDTNKHLADLPPSTTLPLTTQTNGITAKSLEGKEKVTEH